MRKAVREEIKFGSDWIKVCYVLRGGGKSANALISNWFHFHSLLVACNWSIHDREGQPLECTLHARGA